jgi:hypothetical protein
MDIIAQIAANNQIIIGLQSIASPTRRGGDAVAKIREERVGEHMNNAQLKFLAGYSFTAVANHPGLNNLVVVKNSVATRLKEAKARSLDILREFQHAKNKVSNKRCSLSGRGYSGTIRGITKRARASILAGGAILSRRVEGVAPASFITLTIPGNLSSNRDIVPRWTGYICNRLMQIVRRSQSRRDDGFFEWIYCWEYQARGWLHLHMVLQHPCPGLALEVGRNIASAWFGILKEISLQEGRCLFTQSSGRCCYLPRYWQADVQAVSKDVCRYISKYVSKGRSSDKGTDAERDWGRAFPLTRWWGMSRRLCQEVKAHSSKIRVTGLTESQAVEIMSAMGKMLQAQDPTVTYQYSFEVKSGNWHGGWGMKEIFYIPDSTFVQVRDAFASVLRAMVGSLEYGSVLGEGALLSPFGFEHVPVAFPPFLGYNNL